MSSSGTCLLLKHFSFLVFHICQRMWAVNCSRFFPSCLFCTSVILCHQFLKFVVRLCKPSHLIGAIAHILWAHSQWKNRCSMVSSFSPQSWQVGSTCSFLRFSSAFTGIALWLYLQRKVQIFLSMFICHSIFHLISSSSAALLVPASPRFFPCNCTVTGYLELTVYRPFLMKCHITLFLVPSRLIGIFNMLSAFSGENNCLTIVWFHYLPALSISSLDHVILQCSGQPVSSFKGNSCSQFFSQILMLLPSPIWYLRPFSIRYLELSNSSISMMTAAFVWLSIILAYRRTLLSILWTWVD